MDLQKAKAMLESADVIHDEGAVQKAVGEVAAAISARLADKYPLVLCVMTGGVVFCGQLMTRLNFPLDFDYLHATRYGPETQGGKISWRTAPWTSVKGRSVLVVDDILDEGVTLAAVKESLKRMGAAEVLTAVFARKPWPEPRDCNPDFVGWDAPARYLVGYGLDSGGKMRGLPGICALD